MMWNPRSITQSVSSLLNKSSTAKTMRKLLAKSIDKKSEEVSIPHTHRQRNYSAPAMPRLGPIQNRSSSPQIYQRKRSNSAYPLPVSTHVGFNYALPTSNTNSPLPLHKKYSLVSSSTSHLPRKYSMASTSSQNIPRKNSATSDSHPHLPSRYSVAFPSGSPQRNPALSHIGRNNAIHYNHQILCPKRSDPIYSPWPTYKTAGKRNSFRSQLPSHSCPPIRKRLGTTRKSYSTDEDYNSPLAYGSPRSYSPSLPTDLSIFPGPINAMTLSLAIKKNIEKLHKLAEECACLNNFLCENVSQQRSIVAIINKQQTEDDNEQTTQITPEQVQYLSKLNSIANRDIRRACVAYVEYMDTIAELNIALNMAEQDVEVRAGKLTMGSHFRKLEPDAVIRINSACNSYESHNYDEDSDDDFNLYSF